MTIDIGASEPGHHKLFGTMPEIWQLTYQKDGTPSPVLERMHAENVARRQARLFPDPNLDSRSTMPPNGPLGGYGGLDPGRLALALPADETDQWGTPAMQSQSPILAGRVIFSLGPPPVLAALAPWPPSAAAEGQGAQPCASGNGSVDSHRAWAAFL
mmetsp:Transcript_86039/g.267326  ORF Transcript_86039/g.267326 Transcript_86039/m.267326 type:complete len:157 (-) Transcript_86039:9-479(-)